MGPPGRRTRRSGKIQDTTEEEGRNNDNSEQVASEVSSTLGGMSGNLRAHLLPPSSFSSTQSPINQDDQYQPEAGPSRIAMTSSNPAPVSPISEISPTSSFPRVPSGSDEETVPEGHIPRAPNAFILFRSHLIRTEAIPKSVEGKNKDLSKIIGAVWQGLSSEERGHWEREAQEAQRVHRLRYPDWRFAPGIQLGDVSATRRRKRKADSTESGDGVATRRKTRRVKGKQAVVISTSDGDSSKGKKKMKEEDTGDSTPPPVIYAPKLPVPYSFSIPLHSSPVQSRAILPLPTRSTRQKAQSLPLQTTNASSSPPQRRVTAEDLPAQRSASPQLSQASEQHATSSQSHATPSTELVLEPPHDCQWTGHELEQESSPSPYLDPSVPSPQASQSRPFHYFSPPPIAQHSLPSPGYVHDPSNTFYSYSPPGSSSLLPLPPMHPSSHYDPSAYAHMPSPLGETGDFDFSHHEPQPIVPLTQHYRRGSIDPHNTRSPLSQSHTFDDFIGGSSASVPTEQTSSWPSFSQSLRYSGAHTSHPWNEPPPSASSPGHLDMSYGGAVSGGTPLGGYASPTSPLASGYPYHHAFQAGSSELSHALGEPSSTSAHDSQRHRRTTPEGP